MSLFTLLKKGSLRRLATATPATPATDRPVIPPTVATVATVAVAQVEKQAANDPTPKSTLASADIGTVRPTGLSAKLLAASMELDAQVQAVGRLPGNDPDGDCWPHSSAMTGSEIDAFTVRLGRFTDKGISMDGGEALADKLVTRDRETDDRRLCLECRHLSGYGQASWRCGNWQAADVAIRSRDAALPDDLVVQLQHCAGFIVHFT